MEFDIKGNTYQIRKLSVFAQFKVSRKLLPVLSGMLSDFQGIKALVAKKDAASLMEKVLPKIAQSLSDLSEDDANAVIFPCLGVTYRKHAKGWVPVFQDGVLAFDDMDMLEMLQIVGRVVGDSLGNFLRELPTAPTDKPPEA
ncbi:phage tail assembly chaperone [Rahnella inusitata]|uniref:phage tail assembly chaperone n=1 Tax=Rahnella inusitata TaxID=58169 RepID=UPI0039BE60A4